MYVVWAVPAVDSTGGIMYVVWAVPAVDSTGGIMYVVCSCHILMSSSFKFAYFWGFMVMVL